MKTHTNRSACFTLTELLVVVALISLLVALLMPSLKKAKGTAKAVKCQSNLKQIGLGVIMYAHENNDIVPYVVNWRTILLTPVQGVGAPFSAFLFMVIKGARPGTPDHARLRPQKQVVFQMRPAFCCPPLP